MAKRNKRIGGANRFKALQQNITADSAAAVADMTGRENEDMSYEVGSEWLEGAAKHRVLGFQYYITAQHRSQTELQLQSQSQLQHCAMCRQQDGALYV